MSQILKLIKNQRYGDYLFSSEECGIYLKNMLLMVYLLCQIQGNAVISGKKKTEKELTSSRRNVELLNENKIRISYCAVPSTLFSYFADLFKSKI